MNFWSQIPCNEFITTYYPRFSDVTQLSLCHWLLWAKASDAGEFEHVRIYVHMHVYLQTEFFFLLLAQPLEYEFQLHVLFSCFRITHFLLNLQFIRSRVRTRLVCKFYFWNLGVVSSSSPSPLCNNDDSVNKSPLRNIVM